MTQSTVGFVLLVCEWLFPPCLNHCWHTFALTRVNDAKQCQQFGKCATVLNIKRTLMQWLALYVLWDVPENNDNQMRLPPSPTQPPSWHLFMPWADGFTSAQQKDVIFSCFLLKGHVRRPKSLDKQGRRTSARLPVCLQSASWLQCSSGASCNTQCLRGILATAGPVVFTTWLLHLCLRPGRIDRAAATSSKSIHGYGPYGDVLLILVPLCWSSVLQFCSVWKSAAGRWFLLQQQRGEKGGPCFMLHSG